MYAINLDSRIQEYQISYHKMSFIIYCCSKDNEIVKIPSSKTAFAA